MRREFVKAAVKIGNKVNGKTYIVENGIATEAVQGQQFIDGPEMVPVEGGEVIDLNTLTDPQLLVFTTLEFKKPEGIPTGYYLDNGVLSKDGAPVTEQGELKFGEIVGGLTGQVLLTTEPTGEDNLVDLIKYLPDRDAFKTLYRAIPQVKLLAQVDNGAIFGGNLKRLDETDPGYAVIVRVTPRRASVSRVGGVNILDNAEYKTIDGLDGSGYIDAAKLEVVKDDETGEVKEVKLSDEILTIQTEEQAGNTAVLLPFKAESITVCRIFRSPDNGKFVYRTADNRILVSWFPDTYVDDEDEDEDDEYNTNEFDEYLSSSKVAQLAGYEYLIDVNRKDGLVLTFANKEYETKTATVQYVDGPVGKVVTSKLSHLR